jgi:hypothetical protein
MSMNYDASQVGVPYVRASRILISYPDNNQLPTAVIEQALCVKLADGNVRELEDIKAINVTLDFQSHGSDPIPLVNPTTGAALGADTSLNSVMVQILAVVRAQQVLQNV